ncbi:hypothetical protein D3C77_372520 [compost metagenome]
MGDIAENDVRQAGIDVLANTDHIRQFLADGCDPFAFARDALTVGDEDEHHFASAEANLDDDMAKQALSALFVVGGDAQAAADRFDARDYIVVALVLDEARLHIDDAVAAAGVEAADQGAVGDADGHLSLVAVAPRLGHAQRRQHDNALAGRRLCACCRVVGCARSEAGRRPNGASAGQAAARISTRRIAAQRRNAQLADALQRIDHVLALPGQLARVAQVLQLAAAALFVNAARCSYAIPAGLPQLEQLGIAVLLLRLQHLYEHLLTRKRARHKQRVAVRPAHALAVVIHANDVDDDFIVFADR